MNGQIIYTRQSITPILFKATLTGSQYPIIVGGFKGNICLPKLGEPGEHGFSRVIPPTGFDAGTLTWLEETKEMIWGKQLRMPSGETAIANYLLQFRVAKTKRLAMEHMEKIEADLDAWFSTLRDWVEVITSQDLSIDDPIGGTQDTGNYYWSWKSKKRWHGATAQTFYTTSSIPDMSNALSEEQWKYALTKANKRITPPDEHLLLRDARARFNRKQYNYAAIFLGVATEVTLKKRLEEKLIRHHKPRRLIDDLLNNTLGKTLDICESMDIPLPAEARFINKTRNDAAHKNEQISRERAEKSLQIAAQLISMNSAI